MISEIDKLVATLIEADEGDFDVKEVTGEPDAASWLKSVGFVEETGLWVKRMSETAITVAPISVAMPQRLYSVNYYRRGQTGWIFDHRSTASDANLHTELTPYTHTPVVEALEGEPEDWKQIYDTSGFETILEYMKLGLLSLSGKVARTDTHYVHENSTNCEIQEEWLWTDDYPDQERQETEFRVGELINRLVDNLDERMRDWNHKIYLELEQAYEGDREDDVVADGIIANEWHFDEDGNHDEDGAFEYAQLGEDAQATARDEWRRAHDEDGDIYWSEPVIDEWKWLLKNKGFNDVKIGFSGFSSQGDGASFTADSIDFAKYFTGPDPLTFPEEQRDQLGEALEDDDNVLKEIGMPGDVAVYLHHTYDNYSEEELAQGYQNAWEEADGPFVSVSSALEYAIRNYKDSRQKMGDMEIVVKQKHSGIGSLPPENTLATYYVDQDFQLRQNGRDVSSPIGEAAEEDFSVKDVMPGTAWYVNYHYPVVRRSRFRIGIPSPESGSVDIIHSLPGQRAKHVASKSWSIEELSKRGTSPNAELRRRGSILLTGFRKAARKFGDDDLDKHTNAWHWLVAHGINSQDLIARAESEETWKPGGMYEAEDFDVKEVGEPSQSWYYTFRNWPTCRSIEYYVDDTPGVLSSYISDTHGLKTVGGHVFPKRTSNSDLALIARAQVRQFKRAGRYNEGEWENVWQWLKAARAQSPAEK